MRSFSKLLILVILLALSGLSPAEKVVVFLYHRFDDDRYPSTSTSTVDLVKHIQFVRERNYEIWTLRDLVDYLSGRKDLHRTAVLFTVDDGYLTAYTKAFPIFKSFGVPFSVFLYVEGIPKYPDYLTWDMAREMAEWGVEFGLHSFSHCSFPSMLNKMDEGELEGYFRADTVKAREIFEKELKTSALYYAYPYGHYTAVMRRVLKELGFVLAFTQDVGSLKRGYDRFTLPREPLLEDWASVQHLEYIFTREPLLLEEFEPSDRGIRKNTPVRIRARLLEGDKKYIRAQVYVTGKGWLEAEINGSEVSLKDPVIVARDQTRFGIRVRSEDEKWYYRFWYVPVLDDE